MKQDDLINFFQRALKPLRDRVTLMIGRAIISKATDSAKIQEVQLSALADENMEKVQRFQEFGFTSNPPTGTESIIVSLGGARANLISIATEHRDFRKKNLLPGECSIYTDDGTIVHLKKAGNVLIEAATKVLITCPMVEMSGNLLVKGNTVINGTLRVDQDATFMMNAIVNLLVMAGGYAGPISGGPNQVNISVPIKLTASAPIESLAAIETTSTIDAGGDITTVSNVIGGGTDMASIKTTYNGHTHPETGSVTTAPNQTL